MIKLKSIVVVLSVILFSYSCSYQKMNSVNQKNSLYRNLKLKEIQEKHLSYKEKYKDSQMKIVRTRLRF